MPKVTEIKFFQKDNELYIALFSQPSAWWCNEFWLENVKAADYGITELPEGVELEKKYTPEFLGHHNLKGNNATYNLQKIGDTASRMALRVALGAIFGAIVGGDVGVERDS